ncbi:hypothetical protein ACA910_010025 [Epithemia clementina (nom. ined.)]
MLHALLDKLWFRAFIVLLVVAVRVSRAADPGTVDPQCHDDDSMGATSSNSNLKNNGRKVESTETGESQPSQCTLYIAESTIPNAGLGTFTVTPRIFGESLGAGDLCIPYLDLAWHYPKQFFYDPFADYVWMGNQMGMAREDPGSSIVAFCTGLGSIVNSHSALINARRAIPRYDPYLKRREHPGAGAISPYQNATSTVIRAIPAGAELFKSYGDEWFAGRTRQFGHVPLIASYEEAEKILKSFARVASNRSEELQSSLYNLSLAIRDVYNNSRTLNGLPETLKRANIAAQSSISAAYQIDHIRSHQWLQENGRCVDAIEPGYSTISGAGWGAFAARTFRQDQIITASPLLHVPQLRHDYMAMFNITWDEEQHTHVRHLDKVISYQLGMNYCFGHAESSLLLCPNGYGVNYINHAKTGQGANVKIRWAHSFSAHHDDIVANSTLDDLDRIRKSVLVLDYIALRDIDKGEELLIDYGPDWEDAWQAHQDQWLQSNISKCEYISSIDMNQQLGNAALRTHEEEVADPYPSNVEIRCHPHVIFKNSSRNYGWTLATYGHPCRVLDKYTIGLDGGKPSEEYFYKVLVEVWPYGIDSNLHKEWPYDPNNRETKEPALTQIVIARVPRKALRFFDKHGTTDMHLRSAFRHWIGFPDDMFPDQWRNRKQP